MSQSFIFGKSNIKPIKLKFALNIKSKVFLNDLGSFQLYVCKSKGLDIITPSWLTFFKLFEIFFGILEKLIESNNSQLSAIAQKSIKETNYHFRHSSKWIIRLGFGTPESHAKVQSSINNLWMFTEELFEMNKNDIQMADQNIGVDCRKLKPAWNKTVNDIFAEATLKRPEDGHMTTGGRQGIHTEHLGHMLSDMQYLQRSYPDAKW